MSGQAETPDVAVRIHHIDPTDREKCHVCGAPWPCPSFVLTLGRLTAGAGLTGKERDVE